MSDIDTIERALWEAKRDGWEVETIQMAKPTEMRLRLSGTWEWAIPGPDNVTLFGMPILIDPSMAHDKIKLVADCKCVVRLINLG